jgi:hypothetical protein
LFSSITLIFQLFYPLLRASTVAGHGFDFSLRLGLVGAPSLITGLSFLPLDFAERAVTAERFLVPARVARPEVCLYAGSVGSF